MTETTDPGLTLLDQTILQSLRDRGCSTLPDHDHAPCVEEALVDGASLELMRRLLYSWYEYEPDGTTKGIHPSPDADRLAWSDYFLDSPLWFPWKPGMI